MSELVADQWHQIAFTAEALASQWATISLATYNDDASLLCKITLNAAEYGDRWHLWRLVESGEYQLLPLGSDVPPAAGMWMRHKSPTPECVTEEEPARKRFETDVELELFVGWQMAGNPFHLQDVDVNSLKITGPGCAAGCPISRAAKVGLVSDNLWRWNGDNYVDLLAAEGELAPGAAFWIRAYESVTIEFPLPD